MDRADLLFWKNELTNVLNGHREKLLSQINALEANQVLSDQLEQVIQHFIGEFTIAPLTVHEDRLELIEPVEVSVEQYSNDWGRNYVQKMLEFRFELPFSGDAELLKCRPSQFHFSPPRGEVRADRKLLIFIFQSADRNGEAIKAYLNEQISRVKQFVGFQQVEIDQWNNSLRAVVTQNVEARREKLRADKQLIEGMGFNVRRRGAPPTTITFPVTRKSVIPALPAAKPGPVSKPDPTLEIAHYEDILGNLAGMSIAIERSPSTFANIGEEALRDWFLVALNGNFRGDATGETFNREGKTDISVRVGGGVIFIAECKFWNGEKVLLETMDQLLGYLTWRDSKAAILVFSRNVDFTAVLRQIPEIIKKHPKFARQISYSSESGVRFYLQNKTDQAREHLVTLLAFNVPPVGK